MESRLSSPGFAVHFGAPSKKPQAELFGYAAVGKAIPVITLQFSIQQNPKNVWGRGVEFWICILGYLAPKKQFWLSIKQIYHIEWTKQQYVLIRHQIKRCSIAIKKALWSSIEENKPKIYSTSR